MTSDSKGDQLGLRSTASPLAALRIAGQAAEFLGIATLGRRYGASDFGVISVAYVVARYAGLVADRGASLTAARDFALSSNPWPQVAYRLASRRRAALTLAMIFIVGSFVVEPAVAPLGVCVLARGLNRDWIALAQHRGFRAGASNAIQGLSLAILILLIANGQMIEATLSIAAANAIGMVLSIVLNRLPNDEGGYNSLDLVGTRDRWSVTIVLADQVISAADITLISLMSSTTQAGLYAAAYRFPNGWTLAQGLIVAGLIPGVTTTILRQPGTYGALRRRCLKAGALAASLCVALIPITCWLLVLLFGESFAAAQGPLVVLMLAAAASTVTIGLFPVVAALGKERQLAIAFVIVGCLNVTFNLLVIPHFGMIGAALVTLGSQVMLGAVYLRLTATGPNLESIETAEGPSTP